VTHRQSHWVGCAASFNRWTVKYSAHQAGGGVFEALLVLGSDPVALVCGEAGMPPGDELGDQRLRDGALLKQLGQQALAEEHSSERMKAREAP
jgi:hypothetical protein